MNTAAGANIAKEMLKIPGLTTGNLLWCLLALLRYHNISVKFNNGHLAEILSKYAPTLRSAVEASKVAKINVLNNAMEAAKAAADAAAATANADKAAKDYATAVAKYEAAMKIDVETTIASLLKDGVTNPQVTYTFFPEAAMFAKLPKNKQDKKAGNIWEASRLLDTSVNVEIIGIYTSNADGSVVLHVRLPTGHHAACQNDCPYITLVSGLTPQNLPEDLAKNIASCVEMKGEMAGTVCHVPPTAPGAVIDYIHLDGWLDTLISVLQGITLSNELDAVVAAAETHWENKKKALGDALRGISEAGVKAAIAAFNRSYMTDTHSAPVDPMIINSKARKVLDLVARLSTETPSNSAASNSASSS